MKNKDSGFVLWITGLSGSGKTTLAKSFYAQYKPTFPSLVLLDGDQLREILLDREEHVKGSFGRQERVRIALKYSHICKLLSSQGISVVISTISMFNEVFDWNRKNLKNYFEVFIDIPITELCLRDPKDIYKKFYRNEISNVAGLDLKVDKPKTPDLVIDFNTQTKERELEKKIYDLLKKGIDDEN